MNPKENLKDDRIQGDYLNAFTGLLPIGILSLDPWTKMMLRLQPDS